MPDLQPTQSNKLVESGVAQARTLLEIATEINASALKMLRIKPRDARRLYEQAYNLTCNDDSCLTEMAASLAGLACLNNDAGDVDLAVNQNFKVISLLTNFPVTPALIHAYNNLSWIFFSFGDFSSALGYASKALTMAQVLQDNYWEAKALNAYSYLLYVDAADVDKTFELQEKAIQLFGRIFNYGEQALVYNNIADIQLQSGRLGPALEFSRQSLALAKEIPSPIIETVASATLSEVLIAMGEYAQAENFLQEAIEQFSEDIPILFKASILTDLAQIYLLNSQTDKAEASLLKAIEMAVNVKSTYDQVVAHRILSEVYEQMGEYPKALEYLKKFAALNEKLLNERAAKQFYALKIVSDLETAQRDAEIYRLKNVELQNEINERSRFQKELEILAVTDSLTGLYNRRQFFYLANHEIEQVRRFNRAIALVLIDLDDFKQINDTFGHPTGDSVLSSIAGIFQRSIRAVDIVCRYGGEEFAILMPETDSTGCEMIIERVRKALDEQNLIANLDSLPVTFSAGIASFDTGNVHGPADLEILIKWADQALYDAKHAGKNRTVIYSA
jgi:diguanylate cyclase (GGDEF)-like protein